jgi:hypothetical protein
MAVAAISIPHIAGYTFETAANLANAKERARLSPPGLKAYFRIMEKWGILDTHARELLGGMSSGTFYEIKKEYRKRPLSQDGLTRVSLVIGIYKALAILYNAKFANAWINLANTNPMFGGTTPLDYMLRHGQPGMLNVRRLLDARRGGQ